MRTALEERLNRFSKENGIDLMRIRRHVAFDRILARIFSQNTEGIILKGGYAIELLLQNARTTMDIDISVNGTKTGLLKNGQISNPDILQEFLQERVSDSSEDFFEFIIGKSILDLENAPYGGYRFPVEARMAGRLFIKFEIDIAAGDAWIEPHETVQSKDWFGFAGITAPVIPVISKEQQFAEKVHTYTLPRKTPNSRVKDLIDILLFINMKDIDIGKLHFAVNKTFQQRKTHALPAELPAPPPLWKTPFSKLTAASGIRVELEGGFEMFRQFYNDNILVT